MKHLYIYRDSEIYCHHTVDEQPDPADFPMHAHENLEVFYFISGRGSYLVEGTTYELHPGDIMIMRPAETHKLIISAGEPYERIAVHFPAALIKSLDESLLDPYFSRVLGSRNLYSGREYPRLKNAFENFGFSDCTNERAHIVSRLMLFLAELADVFSPGAAAAPEGFQAQLVSYVNENLFEDISLGSIADAFSRSSSQISRVFRDATGSSLWEYVTIKRLLAAQAMMQRGETAAKAGIACGFGDYSAFFRAYKARFGCAPSRDRKD